MIVVAHAIHIPAHLLLPRDGMLSSIGNHGDVLRNIYASLHENEITAV